MEIIQNLVTNLFVLYFIFAVVFFWNKFKCDIPIRNIVDNGTKTRGLITIVSKEYNLFFNRYFFYAWVKFTASDGKYYISKSYTKNTSLPRNYIENTEVEIYYLEEDPSSIVIVGDDEYNSYHDGRWIKNSVILFIFVTLLGVINTLRNI